MALCRPPGNSPQAPIGLEKQGVRAAQSLRPARLSSGHRNTKPTVRADMPMNEVLAGACIALYRSEPAVSAWMTKSNVSLAANAADFQQSGTAALNLVHQPAMQ
jgi:hypothetical protein